MILQLEADARQPDLAPLLNPKAVAVIGVSSDPAKLGNAILRNIVSNGFPGRVYAVAREPVQVAEATTVVRSFSDIKEVIDIAMVAVPAAQLVSVLNTIPRNSVHIVVAIASGFSETGDPGRRLENELRSYCTSVELPLIGPNCQGVVVADARLQMTFSPMFNSMVKGSVAVVAQSGALGAYMANRLMQHGTGIRCFISSGNETCLDASDYIGLFGTDPGTNVILCYLEQIRCGMRFVSAVRSLPPTKRLVVVKSGRSVAGAEAASTHTGALASDDEVVSGVFKELGILRPRDSASAVDVATALATGRVLKGRRIGILSIAGGLAVELTDLLEIAGLEVPEFSQPIREKLKRIVPAFGATRNPIDLTGAVLMDGTMFRDSLDVLSTSDVDAFAIISTYVADPSFARGIVRLFESTEKPVIVCWTGSVEQTPEALRILSGAKVPVYDNTGRAAAAFQALLDHKKMQDSVARRSAQALSASIPGSAKAVSEIRTRLRGWRDSGRLHVHEADVKDLLARAGLPIPRRGGYTAPSVVKFCADTHLHKSDFGFVRLNVQPTEVDAEKRAMCQRGRHAGVTQGEVLVEEMICDGLVEWFVGCKNDSTFGPIVVVGAGGIFADTFAKPEIRMAPMAVDTALDVIETHPAYIAMGGARGRASADIQEFASVICRISHFFFNHQDLISEMDLNPIIVRPAIAGELARSSIVIADATITLAGAPR